MALELIVVRIEDKLCLQCAIQNLIQRKVSKTKAACGVFRFSCAQFFFKLKFRL